MSIQTKASKWDSLIKWIKDSADDEDTDVWEKLAELGVSASGEEEEIFGCDADCGQDAKYSDMNGNNYCSEKCELSQEFEYYSSNEEEEEKYSDNICAERKANGTHNYENGNAGCWCLDDEEEEVCCGGCNGKICNDCPVDNSSIKDLN